MPRQASQSSFVCVVGKFEMILKSVINLIARLIAHYLKQNNMLDTTIANTCPLCQESFEIFSNLLKHVFKRHVCFECLVTCDHTIEKRQSGFLKKTNHQSNTDEYKKDRPKRDQDLENISHEEYGQDEKQASVTGTEDNNIIEIVDVDEDVDDIRAEDNVDIPDLDTIEAEDHGDISDLNTDDVIDVVKSDTVSETQISSEIQCESCDKKFNDKLSLSDHVKSMSSRDTVYSCDKCHKYFTILCALYRHKENCGIPVQKPLKRNLELPPGALPTIPRKSKRTRKSMEILKCGQCKKVLSSETALKYHLENVHSNQNNDILFECDQCDSICKNQTSLRNHIRNIHMGLIFECDECGKILKSQGSLYNHRKLCV